MIPSFSCIFDLRVKAIDNSFDKNTFRKKEERPESCMKLFEYRYHEFCGKCVHVMKITGSKSIA
jgi:hypothetical protein